MHISSQFVDLVASISDIYGNREAENIVHIIFEDAFGITELSEDVFPLHFIQKIEDIKSKLKAHEPFQYILGEADFYGLKFKVNSAVLIPRQETEELVFDLVGIANQLPNKDLKILDIGTGSGCIAITLAKELPQANITAIDISSKALVLAQENANINQVDISFFEMDILGSNLTILDEMESFDIIVSNPPYIPQHESSLMRKNVLDFEPSVALFVENSNPLIFYNVIAKLGCGFLSKNGILAFEINEFLGNDVAQILQSFGYNNIEIINDMQGKNRIVRGQWNMLC